MSTALVARAPTRLDFGGGWTDVPPYPEREGGIVCCAAITRYATASVRLAPANGAASADALVRAAIARSPLSGAHAELACDYPVGAGLGGSSAAGVALAGALAALAGQSLGRHALAQLSRRTEVEELHVSGGYQDHFAAAFGGVLKLTFGDTVQVERIPASGAARAALARRAILVYTGESRISGEQIEAVRQAYVGGEGRVVRALARMKFLAGEMCTALAHDDIDALGALLDEHWLHQRSLHPSISTARIDAMAEATARAGGLGMKALGASGGGCVIAIARDGREDELASALAPHGTRLTYAVDETGFEVIAALDASAGMAHP